MNVENTELYVGEEINQIVISKNAIHLAFGCGEILQIFDLNIEYDDDGMIEFINSPQLILGGSLKSITSGGLVYHFEEEYYSLVVEIVTFPTTLLPGESILIKFINKFSPPFIIAEGDDDTATIYPFPIQQKQRAEILTTGVIINFNEPLKREDE